MALFADPVAEKLNSALTKRGMPWVDELRNLHGQWVHGGNNEPGHLWERTGPTLPQPHEVAEGIAEALNPLAGSKDTPFYRHTVDPAGTLAANPVRSRADALGQRTHWWNE